LQPTRPSPCSKHAAAICCVSPAKSEKRGASKTLSVFHFLLIPQRSLFLFFRHEESTCVVASALKFLTELILSLNDEPSFAKVALQTLDRVGVCHCVPPSSLVVPLMCNLPCWRESVQNMVFAYLGKLIIYHYNEDNTHYRG